MKYSWIIFDADGTLFDYDAAERSALTNTFLDFSIQISENTIREYRVINESLWGKFENGNIAINDLRTKRFSILFEHLGLHINPDSFSEKYLSHLSNGSQLFPNAESVVKILSKHFNLVILTNGIAKVQRSRLKASPIMQYFKNIIISEEEGFSKPSKEIFDITFKRMGNPPKDEVMIVGDSLTSDIAGGNNYGIDTFWICTDKVSINDSPATFKISELSEILYILKV